jgi:hypothetical protein
MTNKKQVKMMKQSYKDARALELVEESDFETIVFGQSDEGPLTGLALVECFKDLQKAAQKLNLDYICGIEIQAVPFEMSFSDRELMPYRGIGFTVITGDGYRIKDAAKRALQGG